MLTQWIKEYVSSLAPILIMPGENELEALSAGALRILKGEEEAEPYID
jgi:butyrate kinase